ncbi:hypothetical protein LXL04_005095 [Taraxacum kok-saghyz]
MAMEVKVYRRKKKTGKTRQIDHIPKCFQLPRSASTSKPRTQFFLPICSSKGLDMSNVTIRHTIDPSTSKSTEPENRRNNEDRNDELDLELTPNSEVCRTPGSVVWLKTDGQLERDNSSSSGTARSKRERKPKVHFDEVSYPLYTSRKVRRFKIMRSLGLAAPVGSPFNSS